MWHRHIHTPGLTRRVREFLVHWLVFQYPDSTRTVPGQYPTAPGRVLRKPAFCKAFRLQYLQYPVFLKKVLCV